LSFTMTDPRVVSQYNSFVIMHDGAGTILPVLHTAAVLMQLCIGWAGRKIDIQETLNKICNFLPSKFCSPHQRGAHGTCHACHTLDTPLATGSFILSNEKCTQLQLVFLAVNLPQRKETSIPWSSPSPDLSQASSDALDETLPPVLFVKLCSTCAKCFYRSSSFEIAN